MPPARGFLSGRDRAGQEIGVAGRELLEESPPVAGIVHVVFQGPDEARPQVQRAGHDHGVHVAALHTAIPEHAGLTVRHPWRRAPGGVFCRVTDEVPLDQPFRFTSEPFEVTLDSRRADVAEEQAPGRKRAFPGFSFLAVISRDVRHPMLPCLGGGLLADLRRQGYGDERPRRPFHVSPSFRDTPSRRTTGARHVAGNSASAANFAMRRRMFAPRTGARVPRRWPWTKRGREH